MVNMRLAKLSNRVNAKINLPIRFSMKLNRFYCLVFHGGRQVSINYTGHNFSEVVETYVNCRVNLGPTTKQQQQEEDEEWIKGSCHDNSLRDYFPGNHNE